MQRYKGENYWEGSYYNVIVYANRKDFYDLSKIASKKRRTETGQYFRGWL